MNAFFVENELGLFLISGLIFFIIMFRAIYLSKVSRIKSEKLEEIAKLGTWVLNCDDNKIWFSSQALKLIGKDHNTHVLKIGSLLPLVHPKDLQKVQQYIKGVREGKGKFTGNITLIRPDKTEKAFYVEGTASRTSNGIPKEFRGILQDISEKRLIEIQLEQAKKMEMIGQLTGGLAHDFNNILMVIHGNLELLSVNIKEDAQQSRRIKAAIGAAERGGELIKRLLGFARKQNLQPTRLNLQDAMPNLIKFLGPTLGESIDITYNVREDTWPVQVDAGQLENSLINLAVNARDAMSGKGELHFDIQNQSITEIFDIDKYQIEPGDYIKLSISDTGIGMSQEIVSHVFEPFFTTKTIGQGSGLGLSMVYGFIKQSNGYINIYSEKNRGTTVTLYLPRATANIQEDLEPSIQNATVYTVGNEKILVVEDEDPLRILMVEYLRGLGYKVFEAQNGPQALNVLKRESGFHLLISDVIMPEGMTGPELALEISKIEPKIKVLFVTGYPNSAFSIYKTSHVFDAQTLIKPYSMMELNKKIHEMLDGAS